MDADYSQYEGFVNFFETPVFSTLLKLRNRVVMVITGNRFGKCVTYHTLIETPNGEIPVGKLFENKKSFDVYAWNGNKKVIAKAKAPFKKEGFHQCYKITMSDGRWIEAADNHRILTNNGYFTVTELYRSFCISPFFSYPLESSLVFCPLTRSLDGLRLCEIQSGSQGSCFENLRLYDGQPRSVLDNVRVCFPSQGGVQQHTSSCVLRKGGQVNKYANNQQLAHDHLSIRDDQNRFLGQYVESLFHEVYTNVLLFLRGNLRFLRLLFASLYQLLLSYAVSLNKYFHQLFSYKTPLCIEGNHIIGIEPIPSQEVYDFEVEKYHNYFAGGLIHHNTKSLQRKNVYRLMGLSPNPEHNIKPEDRCRVVRLAAENLPGDSEREVRNTIYPALMEQIPRNLVLKDITIRKPLVTCQPLLGGKPLQFEFVSYGQTTQSHGGVDRLWIDTDEVCDYDFYEESMPRLATTNGQFFVGTTPIEAGWMYDELFCKAKTIYRTKNVRKYMKEAMGITVGSVEHTDSKEDIAVIQAATDDNPLFQKQFNDKMKDIKEGRLKKEFFPYENVSEYLDSFFMYDDPDSVAMRRYGIFKQITGAVHKEFEWNTHVISEGKHFPNGIPRSGKHCRMIDYHQSVPWAYCWIYIDENDEAFVVKEKEYDPYNNTTLGICRDIAENCRDYKFDFNLIDALANTTQSNSNTTVIQDMNGHFHEMKRSSFGTGGYWEPWDTKGTKGQDKIRERLINSKICGRPFNNLQKIDGVQKRLPTLWVLDSCKIVALSLKNWRKKENADDDRNAVLSTKDSRDKYSQRWSHFNMCLEAAMKDSRFRGTPYNYQATGTEHQRMYFQGRG